MIFVYIQLLLLKNKILENLHFQISKPKRTFFLLFSEVKPQVPDSRFLDLYYMFFF